MKRIILIITGLGVIAAYGFYANRPKPHPVLSAETVQQRPAQVLEDADPASVTAPKPAIPAMADMAKAPEPRPSQSTTSASGLADAKPVVEQAIECLVSRQAGYEQKQAAWRQLKESGKLDQAITELEHRSAADPQNAGNTAALGEAYYKKAGATEDVRETAMLAMKADQTLEAALNLDPTDWDARFTRAVGMSHWPIELQKGQDVVELFQTLIQQQEAQQPQPQFAQSYVRLGDQYQKTGYAGYAKQIWQRGAALFPGDEKLQSRLASNK